jgi:predicted nucleic-acid-binding protein
MIGVDTNVLLRILLEDDPRQSSRAVDLIRGARPDGPVLINAIVLAEVAWTLRRKLGDAKHEIASKIEQILETEGLELMFAQAAARAAGEYRKGSADFADYFLAEINRDFGSRTTFTFDRDAATSSAYSMVP